jgi:hypothetical protein
MPSRGSRGVVSNDSARSLRIVMAEAEFEQLAGAPALMRRASGYRDRPRVRRVEDVVRIARAFERVKVGRGRDLFRSAVTVGDLH